MNWKIQKLIFTSFSCVLRKQQLKHYFFLHDNSANVEELGVNIKAVQFWGGIKDTQEVYLMCITSIIHSITLINVTKVKD